MQTSNIALCSDMTTGQPSAGHNYQSWQVRSTLNLDSIVFHCSLPRLTSFLKGVLLQ